MDITTKIEQLLCPVLADKGYALVRVLFQGDNLNRTLQIMAEKLDGSDMQVADCESLSQTISALLDVEDIINHRYLLEVTSPGIDRPLIKPADYVRFAGREMKLETLSPIDGRKRFKGLLLGLDESGDNVNMNFEGKSLSIPLSIVGKAKLVLTDELITSLLKKSHKE